MTPTMHYAMFAQAETFGRPVRELLTGVPGPLTNMEFVLWQTYHVAHARLIQQQGKAK